MKYLFILNPKSGPKKRAGKVIHHIDKIFCTSGHEYEFEFTTAPGNATQIARNGAAEGFDLITAVGGDGTVNEVASGLINTNAILGIIPLGSGNGIARSLNIPVNVYVSPRKDATIVGFSFGFNIAQTLRVFPAYNLPLRTRFSLDVP